MPSITVRIDNEGTFWVHNPMIGDVSVKIVYDDGRAVEVKDDYLHPMDRAVAPRFWCLEDFLRMHDERAYWDGEDYDEAIEAQYLQFFEDPDRIDVVHEALDYVGAPDLGGDEWVQIEDEFRSAFRRVGLLDELDAMTNNDDEDGDDDTED